MQSLSQPTDAQLADLEERTVYENWFLEAIYDIGAPREDAELVIEYSETARTVIAPMSARLRSDWRRKFLDVGGPLVFITTFKLLDMIVEWVILLNGTLRERATFAEKDSKLHDASLRFPTCMHDRDWLVERLSGLYRILAPFRNILIHTRHFTSAAGVLTMRGAAQHLSLTAEHLRLFALTITRTLHLLKSGGWSKVQDLRLAYLLDQLIPLHHQPKLDRGEPVCVAVSLFVRHGQPLPINVAEIEADASSVYVDRHVLIVRAEVGDSVDRKIGWLVPWGAIENRGDIVVIDWLELAAYAVNPDEVRAT